ncbi:unnamed protein product [Clavelina lepadiformis]|uniref:Bcl-2 Bcl-2 homology region 1-3 domain-containing protein n=1 Tax=Clavelina lepadiformis TaxID=159417 RepID=A0ABP0GHQ2_CLALP
MSLNSDFSELQRRPRTDKVTNSVIKRRPGIPGRTNSDTNRNLSPGMTVKVHSSATLDNCAFVVDAFKTCLKKASSAANLSISSTEGDDSVFVSMAYDDAWGLTAGLVRDYICYCLKRSGFITKVKITEYPPARNRQLSSQILNIGAAFEIMHPTLYKNFAKKLGYIFDSEKTLRRLYYRLATHIIGTDPNNYTWCRIVSLFCVGGAMAVDCVAQGHSELIEPVIKISSDFVKSNVLDWIVSRGGWQGMPTHFNQKRPPRKTMWFSEVAGTTEFFLFPYVILLGSVIVGVVTHFVLKT